MLIHLLYANYIFFTSEATDRLINEFRVLKDDYEDKGLKVNFEKTKVMPIVDITNICLA